MTTIQTRTLSERIAEGKLPVSEALRIAASLADALRAVHDGGRIHGALTPSHVQLAADGVELAPAQGREPHMTAYTAPEAVRGQAPDSRSDIFSFGAIVLEMITGRPAFEGATPELLAASILNTPAPPTGNRALDTLLANCLAKDPASRWQRIQKVQLELKLLSVSARRAETPAQQNIAVLVRSEVQHALASRIGDRLDAQDHEISELKQAVSASLQAVQAHLCTVDAKLAAAQEDAKRSEQALAGFDLRISNAEAHAAPMARLTSAEMQIQAATERMSRVEQATQSARQQSAEFAEGAAMQLHALEQTIRSQADALESARTALAQTDDLVERVVEALDSLQSIVLERAEDRPSEVS